MMHCRCLFSEPQDYTDLDCFATRLLTQSRVIGYLLHLIAYAIESCFLHNEVVQCFAIKSCNQELFSARVVCRWYSRVISWFYGIGGSNATDTT